jgi:hypothetical protein
MVDPRTATTSYIFARASEPVNWDEVTTKIDGKKHKEITVFYESFARDNSTAVIAMLGNTRSPMQRVVGTTSGMSTLTIDGPLTVKGPVTFGKDSAGRAKMLVGDSRVRVAFASAYQTMPIVNVTPVGVSALDANFKYAITEQEKDHFTIETSNPAYREVVFNWTAVASAEDALEIVSDGTSVILNSTVIEVTSSVEIVPETPAVPASEEVVIPEAPAEEPVATTTPIAEPVSTSTTEIVIEEVATSTPVAEPVSASTPETTEPIVVPSEEVVPTSTDLIVENP